MIDVKCLASSSAGNSYAVDDGETVLLLEAGIASKKILSGYAELLDRVAGCLVTHEHKDHAKAAWDLTKSGIDVYTSEGTQAAICPSGGSVFWNHRLHTVKAETQYRIGSWFVVPWEAQHDCAEPLGFLLYSTVTKEKLLFATDTYFIPNTFQGLNIVLVECNYDLMKLTRNVDDGVIPAALKPRILQSHFSLANVKDFLTANELKDVRRIYLCHVSKQNGDKQSFKNEIEALTGIPVTVF